MRPFILLTSVASLLLPLGHAYADASCNSVSNAFRMLERTPDFTIFESSPQKSGQRKIAMQGRPDGIYTVASGEANNLQLAKSTDRSTFSQGTHARIEKKWANPDRSCSFVDEQVINGKNTVVYTSGQDRMWLGADDGLFYQIFADGKLYNVIYGPEKNNNI